MTCTSFTTPPADPTAQLTATGNLSFGDDSRFEVDLGATGGGSFDQIRVGHLATVDMGGVAGEPQRVNLTVRLTAGFGDRVHCLVPVGDVGDHHLRPLASEELGGDPLESRCGAGDERHLVVQPSRPFRHWSSDVMRRGKWSAPRH